jgi:hypothetical protein
MRQQVINLPIPEKYFDKDKDNRLELRLANFQLKKGDIIRFREYNKKTKRYSGRYFDKVVSDFHKVHKALKSYSKKDLDKYGIYILELFDSR